MPPVPTYLYRHEHYNADGFCEACGAYQKANKSGEYYEIYNAGQLFWFAKQFNDGEIPNKSNLKLMKDIEIPDGYAWTSIGAIADGKSFEGNIEGNYHVISGLRPADDGTSSQFLPVFHPPVEANQESALAI